MRQHKFTKEELVKAAHGDNRAGKVVYDKLFDTIVSVVRSHHGGSGLVRETTQDIIVKIFKRLDSIDPKTLIGFSLTSARNHCIDMYRQTKTIRKTLINLDGYTNIDYSVILEHLSCDMLGSSNQHKRYNPDTVWCRLEEAINSLTPTYQEIFRMYYLDDMTHKQIADELGIATGTSKSNLHKAKRNLRAKLGSYNETLLEDFEFIA